MTVSSLKLVTLYRCSSVTSTALVMLYKCNNVMIAACYAVQIYQYYKCRTCDTVFKCNSVTIAAVQLLTKYVCVQLMYPYEHFK